MMGGLAGWVDYTRDLAYDRDIVATMLGRLAWRGSAEWGVWSSPRAIIGHHRAGAGVPAGAPAPAVAELDGVPAVVLALDGEIYNHQEIRGRLAAAGHMFPGGAGQSEVVARAYLEWGAQCATKLDGVFAFAAWDVRRQELMLVGDRLGLRSIYYQITPDGVLFGSEPKAILAHPSAEALVDESGLRELLSFTVAPGRSVFRDIQRLRQGELLRIDATRVTSERYWSLQAQPHPDSAAKTVATWRGMLEESVAKRLDAHAPLGVLLSGGLDSSALVGLAAGQLGNRGDGPLRTYTLDFTGQQQGPALHQTSRDAPYAEQIAELFGTQHTRLTLERSDLEDPVFQQTMVAAQQDRPTPTCDFTIAVRYLCRMVGQQTPVLLSGQQAGLMFNGALGTFDPASLDAGTFPWIAFTQRRTHATGIGTGLFSPDLLRRLELPEYCADQYRQALATVPTLDGEDKATGRAREVRYLSLTGWHEFVTVFDTGLTQTAGVTARWPYCTPEIIQYCYNLPADLRDEEGAPLEVAQAALSDLLPESVLRRAPSPFPTGIGAAGGEALRRRLSALLDENRSPVLPLLDLAAARQLLSTPPRPERAWRDRSDIQMVLQTDAWLEQCRVRLV